MSYQTPAYGAATPGYGQTQPKPPRRKGGIGFWLALTAAAFFFVCCVILFFLWIITVLGVAASSGGGVDSHMNKRVVRKGGDDQVLLIPVRGLITNQETQDLFAYDPGSVRRIREQLKAAIDDDAVKAVVLEIDSPGGAITACDVIHKELTDFRKSGKPVVAYLGDVAASGGYYVACAADEILAHPTCLTGSIGVIMPRVNFSGLLEKIGVKMEPIKSGERKDIGAGYRDMAPEEQKALQDIIMQLHGRFAGVVRASVQRRVGVTFTDDELAGIANGMVYTGADAVKLRLVDSNGYMEDAIAAAETRAGIRNAEVIRYVKPAGFFQALSGADCSSAAPAAAHPAQKLLAGGPKFLYLWTGVGIDQLASSDLINDTK